MTELAAPLAPADVALDAKVAFLSRKESYPHPTTMVEMKETHMSCVFLTDAYAYKLKKPVRMDFLDFGTLEARRINCDKEVQLNRRLASGIYLGLAALSVDDRGQLRLDGNGECVDWLVKMRRLPAWRNLENLISAGSVHEGDIRCLAHRLAAFYAGASPVPVGPETYRHTFEAGVRDSHAELVRPIYGLSAALVDSVATALLAVLACNASELQRRAAHVVEAHGDLRPEHAYLTAHPVVVDCLEFNRDFRLLDPASELAYLAMECDRLGAPFVENWLFDVYRTGLGDDLPADIVRIYKSCNALLRARIAIKHLDEPHVVDRAKWTARANQYLCLAQKYLGPSRRRPH